MRERLKLKIGAKIVAMVLLIGITLSVAAILVGWWQYSENTNELVYQIGQNAADTLAANLSPEEVDYYYQTKVPDARYYEIQRFLHTMTDDGQVKYLYVSKFQENGLTYIFDAAGGVDANGACSLGFFQEWGERFTRMYEQYVEGEEIQPITYTAPSGETIMSIVKPISYENGTVAGFVSAGVEMERVVQLERSYLLNMGLLLLLLTGLLMGLSLHFANWKIIRPIRVLTAAVEDYENPENKQALRELRATGKDELSSLASAFQMMVAEIQMSTYFEKEVVVREEHLENELSLAREIGGALVPKSLPRRKGGYPFEIRGLLYPEESLSGSFYDYFLGDRNRLCVLVGDVPGEGVSQVLYTAMARAILKSQLRSGLGLAEAVSEANRQINELSDNLSLNILVGVLDSGTGQFSYVNAGGEVPFLYRSEDRYHRIRAHTYSPLGQSANVAYQVQEVELRQGDRLLLFSGNLSKILNGEGDSFGEKEMGTALNERELRLGKLEKLLSELRSRGSAFAAHPGNIGGYALLALEYSRRNQVIAHQVVKANTAGGGVLRRFIRSQMEANGLSARTTAEIVVLGDELFALCCRQADKDIRFMVECEVPTGENEVRLRLKGDMGGRDPLRYAAGESARNGADFIRKSCERVQFEQNISADEVTLVRRISE